MREIKFRAWDKKLKKMLSVCIVNIEDGIVQAKHTTGTGTSFGGTYEVRKFGTDMLMQYTGLKDKNGKEIYEGDILDVDDHKRTVEVVWFSRGGCYDTTPLKITDELQAFRGLQNHDWNYRTKVIGNIYENPELLENK